MTADIRPARTAEELAACFPVMQALRPHLNTPAELIERVQRQASHGYHLLAAWSGKSVIGAAGYRMQENLIRGRFCYVDDLVVAEHQRRHGLGARLLDAVAAEARAAGITRLTLARLRQRHPRAPASKHATSQPIRCSLSMSPSVPRSWPPGADDRHSNAKFHRAGVFEGLDSAFVATSPTIRWSTAET